MTKEQRMLDCAALPSPLDDHLSARNVERNGLGRITVSKRVREAEWMNATGGRAREPDANGKVA